MYIVCLWCRAKRGLFIHLPSYCTVLYSISASRFMSFFLPWIDVFKQGMAPNRGLQGSVFWSVSMVAPRWNSWKGNSKYLLPDDFSQHLAQLCAPAAQHQGESRIITTVFMSQAVSIIPPTWMGGDRMHMWGISPPWGCACEPQWMFLVFFFLKSVKTCVNVLHRLWEKINPQPELPIKLPFSRDGTCQSPYWVARTWGPPASRRHRGWRGAVSLLVKQPCARP